MRKGLTLVLFLFAFAIISFGLMSAAPYNCSDSDGGVNYAVYGYTWGYAGNNSYQNNDTCSGNTLYERFCANSTSNTSVYNCGSMGSGYICLGGKCVQSNQTCTPDPVNITCAGTQCGIKVNNCGQNVNCGTCSPGYICFNSVCIPSQPIPWCSDSDGGLNYYTYGIVSTNNGNYSDSCLGQWALNEYYCQNTSLGQTNITCTYGCIGGYCKQIPPVKCSFFKKIFKPSLCVDSEAPVGINAQVVNGNSGAKASCGIIQKIMGKCKSSSEPSTGALNPWTGSCPASGSGSCRMTTFEGSITCHCGLFGTVSDSIDDCAMFKSGDCNAICENHFCHLYYPVGMYSS